MDPGIDLFIFYQGLSYVKCVKCWNVHAKVFRYKIAVRLISYAFRGQRHSASGVIKIHSACTIKLQVLIFKFH